MSVAVLLQTIFIPLLLGGGFDRARGVAGPVTQMQQRQLVAVWYHRWSPCLPEDVHCVDAVKVLDPTKEWLTAEAVQRTAEKCRSGYFLIGQEYEMKGWDTARQVQEFQAVAENVLIANPNCKIIGGGWLAWSPYHGDGRWRVSAFREEYLRQYGTPPPLAGVHFHSYLWPERDFVDDTQRMVAEVERVYPGLEIWVTETGCLEQACQMEALGLMNEAMQGVDRWAFFLSYEAGLEYTSLLDADGNLTELGQEYRRGAYIDPAPLLRDP